MVPFATVLVAAVLAVTVSVPGTASAAPTSVTIAGSQQSELGCASDWDPACAASALTYDATDQVWQGTQTLPAGSYEYKAAIDGSWTENYGLHAVFNGANIGFTLAPAGPVKFYYDPTTHWATDSKSSVIVTAAGNFQSELGCASDWDPSCLRSWLQDPDGDGVYVMTTTGIPAGSYLTKAAINEGWDESYGAGGDPAGAEIAFTVLGPSTVTFSYNTSDGAHLLTVTVTPTSTTPTPGLSPSPGATSPGASADRTAEALASTGSGAMPALVFTGSAVLLLGLVLVVATRRRRRSG